MLAGDDYASGRHARVESGLDGTWVVDLGSTNGTYVNGERLEGRRRLHEGDLLQVGDTGAPVRAMRLGGERWPDRPGRVRRRNEDSFVLDPPMFAVADGMGGAQAGEVASRLAAAAFREYHDADQLAPDERVQAIIQEANRRIYERARADSDVSGMGTTVTAALLLGGKVTLGHVGDSRAYRIRDGELEQLTDDHSLVGDLMRSGRLTPEEAEAHPQRSVITRALGTDPEVDIDTTAVDARPGDLFLLCSDGLTTMVADEDILGILAASPTLDDAARELVRAANTGGGEDNVTVVLFRVEGDEATEETLVAPPVEGTGRATWTSSRTR